MYALQTMLWVLKLEVHNMWDTDGVASIQWLRNPNTRAGFVYRNVHPKAYLFDPLKGTTWIKEVMVFERNADERRWDIVKDKFEW